jgi:hypothetical protein
VNKIYLALLLLPLLLVAPGRAIAQNTGTLSGNVSDSAGALVPGAEVTLVSPTVGTRLSNRTNSHGEYLFSAIPIGVYTLTVKAPSFADSVRDDIAIDAAQNVRVDAHLQPAGNSASVTVNMDSSAVDTQSGTVGTVIDQKLIDNLPIDGNNIVALTAILPGVVDVSAPTTFTQPDSGPTYSANGSRANQNLMLLDGSMWNNVFYNTGLNYPPPPALAEVTVLLNNYKAQYGRNAGSVFNVLTRTGTNAIHGTIWEYLQNSAFNASDYITQVNPKIVQNQFGATIGGPILRDKLHYFFSYQGLRAAQQAVAQANTLLPEERGVLDASGTPRPCITPQFAGMTCASFASANSAVTLVNPMYRAPAVSTTQFNAAYQQAGGTGTSPCVPLLSSLVTSSVHNLPNAEVPSVCFNPVTQKILKSYVPYPTGPGTTTITKAPLPQYDRSFLFRVDYALTRHTLDMRYYNQSANDTRANAATGGTGVSTYEVDKNFGDLNFGSIGDTWVISPNMLNIFRAGYKRYEYYVLPTDPTTAQNLGMAITLPAQSLPTISVYNRFTLGSSGSAYLHAVNENLQVDDSISWQHKTHSIQAGVSWLRLQYLSINDAPGSFTFFNQGFGYPAADFLGGLLNTETVSNRTTTASISPNLYMYAQDDWRASPRLTLNYGLRYELPFMWKQPNQQAATFIPGFQSTRFPQAPVNLAFVGDPGIRDSLVPTPKTGIAPRFGFSYDTTGTGRTTLRGGFGLFYDAINASVVGTSTPFHYAATYTQPAGGISQPLLGLSPVPGNFDPKNPQFIAPFTTVYPDHNFTTPYTEAGNLGVTQKLGSGFFEVDYLIKLGRHQMIPVDQNPAIYDCSGAAFKADPSNYCTGASTSASSYNSRVQYPNFNYGGAGVVDLETSATSSYHALQVIAAQRGRKTISFQTSYTYSRSLDLLSNGQTLSSAFPQANNIRSQFGPSDFNATHIFNMGWVVRFPTLHRGNSITRSVVNDWQFTGLYSARTGHPFTVTTADDVSLTKEAGQRAFLVPGMSPTLPSSRHRVDKVNEWFNTNAFCGDAGDPRCPGVALGQFSTLSRNSLVGPAYISTNFGLGRGFALPYRETHLQFRADAFNVFNTPNLQNPNAKYSDTSGLFGTVRATVGTNGNVLTNGRRVQVSLVLKY